MLLVAVKGQRREGEDEVSRPPALSWSMRSSSRCRWSLFELAHFSLIEGEMKMRLRLARRLTGDACMLEWL
jgi:hypothetical protein